MLRRLSITYSAGIEALTLVCCAALAAPGQPLTQPAGIEPGLPPLRICAAKTQPPFSLEDKSGYENKIAFVLAETLGREPQFIWSPKLAIYLVRDFLDKKLCDVIIGLDTGDPRVLTTTPYMRTGYVFVSRADRGLQVRSWSDPELKKLAHIAVPFGSPAEIMLKEIGRYEDEMPYLYSLVNFRSPRNQYTQIDSSRMVSEVVNGTAALAVAFAPEIARFVKLSPIPLRMTLIEDDARRADGERVPLRYDQSIGVRRDDKALLAELNAALRRAQPKIDEILASEGIPTLPIAHEPAAGSK